MPARPTSRTRPRACSTRSRSASARDVSGLRVAIVGDLRHSRVARSTGRALLTLGVGELRLVSPASLMPEPGELEGASRTTPRRGIRGADV